MPELKDEKETRVHVQARLDLATYLNLQKYCKMQGNSMTGVIELLIRKFIEKGGVI